MNVTFDNAPCEWCNEIEALAKDLGLCFTSHGTILTAEKAEHLSIKGSENNGFNIKYSSKAQLCRALSYISDAIRHKKQLDINEKPVFNKLGVMLDASRGAVPLISNLKALLRQIVAMGYDRAMLYTEDTYEIESEAWFSYMRGGYSIYEIKELDTYATALGIELIPCIQTMAHLERFLHWPASAHYRDNGDILLTDDEATDVLINKMLVALRQMYTSKHIHLGMDEAMGLGLGRHLLKHGFEPPVEIMKRHVDKVCKMALQHGFEPMMWSDMYFRLLSQTHDYYDVDSLPEDICSSVPSQMQLVYWDYYHTEKDFYAKNLAVHKHASPSTAFAGGAWSWLSPVTDYDLFFSRSLPALEACKEAGICDVWLTVWGDDGAEASLWSALPAMQVYAEYCYTGAYDYDTVCNRFKACTGQAAQCLLALSRFNRTPFVQPNISEVNGAKLLLYDDPLLGLFNEDIKAWGFEESYKSLAVEYGIEARKAKGHFKQLLRYYQQLALVLSIKAELCVNLQNAYKGKNAAKLRDIANVKIPQLCKRIKVLTSLWRGIWLYENKPNGFEVHDIRLGGVLARLLTAKIRVNDYLHGKIKLIEELEVTRIPYLTSSGQLKGAYFWSEIASAARL